MKLQNNPLQDIKVHKSTKYLNNKSVREVIQEKIADITTMSEAWEISPKLQSEQQKKAFLGDFVQTAKTIGVHNTCEHLLPCLIACFNCDETVHPDTYDNYARMLFNNLDKLIAYLSKNCAVKELEKSETASAPYNYDATSSESDGEISSDMGDLEDLHRPKLSGYYGLSTLLLDEVYLQFFEPERIEDTLKQEIQNQVIAQLVQISKVLTASDIEEKILPLVLECIRDEESDDRRLTGVILFDELATILGPELCREQIMHEFIGMQDDPIFKIRREMVVRLVEISRILGPEILVGVIIPVYKKLSQDSIWSVRKACVEILPKMAEMASEDVRKT